MNAAVYRRVFLSLILSATSSYAADWPSWGGRPSRNMASETEKGLPDGYALGGLNYDRAAMKNIKWFAKLGGCTCGSPVVSRGRVLIGTTGASSDDILLCLDEQTGRELGRFVCRRPPGRGEHWGVCSTPTVEGDRLYLVTPYGEAECVNVASWLSSRAKASAEESDRHIVWKYDMVEKLHVEQDHTASCSPLVLGGFVYVCTGNERYKTTQRPLHPLTPSLIAFNKHTGQLVARDDEQIGEQLWRGQWSSPSLAMVNGKPQILFATGNGLCYGFEPVDPAARVAPDRWITQTLRGPIVYYINVEKKNTAGLTPAQYAKAHHVLSPKDKPSLPLEFRYSIRMPATTPINSIPKARVPDVPILKKVWWFDCLPPEFRNAPFYAQGYKGDGKIHPCDIIATPVFYRNRVYVAIGGDPQHGSKNSRGHLVCIDATKTGNVTRNGFVWRYDGLNATLTTVAIADGLLFIIDEASVVHCLDADTGQKYWTYELKSDRGLLTSALVVADGKVFVGKSILAASKTLKILGAIAGNASTSCCTPCIANGVLFTVHGKRLWAVCGKCKKSGKSWVSLFDGRSLAGWKVTGCEAVVRDGAILLKSGNGLVRTERTYRDFVLEVDWKALKADHWDSGVFFRSGDPPPGEPWPKTYQANLRKGVEGNVEELKTARSTGLTRPGQWNHFKLTVMGPRAELEINDKPAWKSDEVKDPSGYIGLQAEVPGGGQFLFRNIRIKEMQ